MFLYLRLRYILLSAFLAFECQLSLGQLNLSTTGTDFLINFDQTVLGVNEGFWSGIGLRPIPDLGQLDSEAFSIIGFSDGPSDFGDISISGDFSRGISTGNIGPGGLYSFEVDLNNHILGFQPVGSDFTPGFITLKVLNTSGFAIDKIKLSFLIWVLNNNSKSSSIEVFFSTDNLIYNALPGSFFTSPEAGDNFPSWQFTPFSFSIENMNVANNNVFYIRWETDDNSGTGSRDELGIDDISIRISNNLCLAEAFILDELGILQSVEGLILNQIADKYTSPGNFGNNAPSARLDIDAVFIETQTLTNPNSMQFWIKGQGNTSGSSLLIEGFNGSVWNQIDVINPLPSTGTIFHYQNLLAFERVRFTYNKIIGNLAFDDLQIFCGDCIIASKPTIQPSNTQIVENLCNQALISWDGGNAEYFLIVASSDNAISFFPNDGISYSTNTNIGFGQEVVPGEFAVYSGTNSSFLMTGLESNTNYHIKVFGFNGLACEESYLVNSFDTHTFTTPNCNQCPFLVSALINPCAGNCSANEGYNELLFLNSGGINIPVNGSFSISYVNSSDNLLNQTLVSHPEIITQLNATPGCAGVFIDASSQVEIPANSKIVLINENICLPDIDFSALCGNENVFLLFVSSTQWNALGEFSNTGQEIRQFQLDFQSIETGCLLNYGYVPNNIPQSDGAVVGFARTGGLPVSFTVLQNCNLTNDLLPVSLGKFTATQRNSGIELFWETYSETINAGFSIERRTGENLPETIGWVDGSGTSPFYHSYSFIDKKPVAGLNFYRLKQTDWDGNFEYSSWVVSDFIDLDILIYLDVFRNLKINSTDNDKRIELTIFDLNGQKLNSYSIEINSQGRGSVELSGLDRGIYLVQYTSTNFQKVIKIVY